VFAPIASKATALEEIEAPIAELERAVNREISVREFE